MLKLSWLAKLAAALSACLVRCIADRALTTAASCAAASLLLLEVAREPCRKQCHDRVSALNN